MTYRLRRAFLRDWLRPLAAVLAVLALWGCAAKAPIPRATGREPATLRPYTIKGVTYTPLRSARGYREEGIASWYGPGFHGHSTSNGEIYDQYQATCAHKLLPMHTMVRVTNLENGRSMTLRVNDRGPFVAGRIIDLSLAGARELGVHGRGTARVRVEVEGDVPGLLPDGELPGPFYVQVGAFTRRENADRLYSRLVAAGYAGSRVHYKEIDGTRFFRVHAGTFPTEAAAEEARIRLGSVFAGAFVLAQ
ncbi:rare lipoprotein A [Solidesulfovibrio carbinoliphilus subsp. oakridgensis]|uniref:Probable endolytic peptidoglycan transglycosylase RlpA n=1 Tax=Solidesulfovibrio carbinoliphilus subsp. oakridgensis TaxID=694327 RepID=G7Q569_9BACT|nr:septal ring lytic transglycosylase RlpA family protein [Solidesulfovibrio carbinoliphilus]EHJ48392.1 rare lipoprotein A [Solidesulfovibrio carbinoliphilus subsp. oakridgensis]